MNEDLESFIQRTDKQTVDKVREYAGLPKLYEATVRCKRCRIKFKSQFSGKRRLHFFCARCHHWQGKQSEEMF